jgi:hypothetical protein
VSLVVALILPLDRLTLDPPCGPPVTTGVPTGKLVASGCTVLPYSLIRVVSSTLLRSPSPDPPHFGCVKSFQMAVFFASYIQSPTPGRKNEIRPQRSQTASILVLVIAVLNATSKVAVSTTSSKNHVRSARRKART